MSWCNISPLVSYAYKSYSRVEKAILIENASSPNRMSAYNLHLYFLYNFNSFHTPEAITRQTQRLLQEQRKQNAEASSDQHDDGIVDDAEVCDAAAQNDQDCCAICLQAVAHHSFELQCKHAFCTQCLQRWFARRHDTCPTCRATVPPDIQTQLLQGTSMPHIFDLGSRLATSDMGALEERMALLMVSLHTNALLHPLHALLSETSRTVLHAIGVDAADLTFKPYLDHMTRHRTHGMTARSIGQRITALCAINASGLRTHHTAVDAGACAAVREELQDARLCNTCPLWLDQHGVEMPPKVLGPIPAKNDASSR